MDVVVIPAVFVTALLSGVFGMAGGLLLLLVLSASMPIAPALVVHGAAQLMANATRAVLSARNVRTAVLGPYAIAAALAFAVFAKSGLVIGTATVLLLTGSLPWLEPLVRPVAGPTSVERPFTSLWCGFLVTALHLTAGVSGPLLDQFFTRTALTRHEVVATKAATQSLGHALKILYFGELAGGLSTLPWKTWLMLVLASLAGTGLGRALLDRMDENGFRSGTKLLVRGVGLVCVARGLMLHMGCSDDETPG